MNRKSTYTPTEVHRVVLMVVDHDRLGAEEVKRVLQETKYPNHCMRPSVMEMSTEEVNWHDNHPLNIISLEKGTFRNIFEEDDSGEDDAGPTAGLEAECDELRSMLVEACYRMYGWADHGKTENDKVFAWWREYRPKYEAEQERKARAAALAKLTSQERELLGLTDE